MDVKRILACAALLAGLLFFNGRLSAAVESDVVGYTTIEVTKKFLLVGASIFPLDSEGVPEKVSVHDFIKGDFAEGDELQIPNGNAYDRAIWHTVNGEAFWCKERRGVPVDEPSDLMVSSLDGVWLNINRASTTTPVSVSFLGRIDMGTVVTKEMGKRYQLASITQPIECPINSEALKWDGLTDGDELQIQNDNNSYDRAIWHTQDGASFWSAERRGQPTGIPSTLVIKPSTSFWVVTKQDGASMTYSPKSGN